ncbi:protein kinase [Spirillospora sp. NPDC050679]
MESPRVRPGVAPVRELRPTDPTRVGPYALQGRIGEGGMGAVYLGRGPDGHPVAVKIVRPELADDRAFLARFHDEARNAERVASFCTAQVLRHGEDLGTAYLVTEYIDGPSLLQHVSDNGPLSPGMLHGVAVGVAAALVAIHSAGLVHRDLKPSNVLLSITGPRVIDFGIARALDEASGHTRTGQVVGTPGYIAPEQITTQQVSPAVDVFAWGCLVAYAANGRNPFGQGSFQIMVGRALHAEPELGALTEPLAGLVREALSKEPERRPTARGLLLTLVGGGATESDVNTTLGEAWTAPPVLPPNPGETVTDPGARHVAPLPGVPAPRPDAGAPSGPAREHTPAPAEDPAVASAHGSAPASAPDSAPRATPGSAPSSAPQSAPEPTPESAPGSAHESAPGPAPESPPRSARGPAPAFVPYPPPGPAPTPEPAADPASGSEPGTDPAARQRTEPSGPPPAMPVPGTDPASTFPPQPVPLPVAPPSHRRTRRSGPLAVGAAAVLVAAAAAGTYLFVQANADGGGKPEGGSGTSSAPAAAPPAGAADKPPAEPMLVRIDTEPGWPKECHGDIGVYTPGSPAPTTLVRGDTCDILPERSPDRSQIAFTRSLDGKSEAWVTDAEGSRPRRVTDRMAGGRVTWSPDGTLLAFMGRAGGVRQIFTVPADGKGSPRQLTTDGADKDDPMWSSTGRIAFWSKRDGVEQIYTLSPDSPADWTRVTKDGVRSVDPEWSPDGEQIAYTRGGSPGADIWLVGADGRGPHALVKRSGHDMDPAWSADGKWVCYAHGPTETPQLRAVRAADGKGDTVLTPKGHTLGHPNW